MKKETKITHTGRDPINHSGSVNPPIYQTSTIVFPTLEAYFAAENGHQFYDDLGSGRRIDFSYGIGGTPTNFALQEAIKDLEGGDCTWLYPSGLSAITTALLAFVEEGDHILVTDNTYSPTRRFCHRVLKKLGVETEYYDPLVGADISKLIRKNTKLIFLESPGSLTFEIHDVPAITKVAKKKDVITIHDNSWATPLFFDPLKHGVDISIHAITKYINGHADVFLGSVTSKEKHRKRLNDAFRNIGAHTNPHACYLALRGLRTLDVRMQRHFESALKVAKALEKNKKVRQVLYPGLPSFPQHKLWKRDFTGANGLISFVLDKQYTLKQLGKFIDKMDYFSIGASWGGYESLILPFSLEGARTATKWPEKNSCIRIHIGLENADDLIADLEKGLKRL